MALKIRSAELYAIRDSLDANLTHQAYNALDSAVTLRVWEKLTEVLSSKPISHHAASYAFVRAMQGPALDMMTRGVMIQQKVRQDETQRYTAIRQRAQARLDALADAIWGPEEYVEVVKSKETWTPVGARGQPLKPRTRTIRSEVRRTRVRGLNASSAKQTLAFFNIALGLPVEYEIRKTAEGSQRTPTANDKALRKWAGRRMKGPGVDVRDRQTHAVKIAKPFVDLILAIRDADKMLGVLRTPLDPDGRLRCSYNVVGTESGRWSSSKSAFGRGTNLQNITPTMRRMFCADDGYRLVSTDLEQAEARVVAALVWQTTGDRTYLDACLSADLHTQVCMMAWPELEWKDDDAQANRKLADLPYPEIPSYTYRDVAKRIGHGSNYGGTPFGIAAAVGMPANIVEEFQRRYLRAFPAIAEWHKWISNALRTDQYLDTPLLRRRYFFGRPWEDSTLREAIAFIPQSTVAELLNKIMLKVWLRSKQQDDLLFQAQLQLLLQNHDAFLFQINDNYSTTLLKLVISEVNHEFDTTTIPFVRGDERLDLSIPGEFVTGWNWAYVEKGPKARWHFADGNVDGLRKWDGRDDRVRQQGARVRPHDWLGGQLPRIY